MRWGRDKGEEGENLVRERLVMEERGRRGEEGKWRGEDGMEMKLRKKE